MLKRLLAAALVTTSGWAHATDVGVSVQISQPGVYGRIDIGRFPQPAVIGAQPKIIMAPPRHVQPAQPVYLWVPPGHQKNWRKHCSRYNACGVPVYFVREQWYRQHVMAEQPQRKEGKGHGRGHQKEHGHGHGKGRGD